MSIGPHTHRHLDNNSKVEIELPLRNVAERVDGLNYGTQRFLSHLVDVRREALAKRIAEYRARGHEDAAQYAEREGDKLADGIEAMLREGLY